MARRCCGSSGSGKQNTHIKITELLRFRMLILVDDLQANQPPKRNMRV